MAKTKSIPNITPSTSPNKLGTGNALSKPVQPDKVLAAIIGSAEALPRTQVTVKVWDYIKLHKLQDSKNRKLINADSKLKELFGAKDQVSMFELTKLVSAHLK